jgi:hypothetical protein
MNVYQGLKQKNFQSDHSNRATEPLNSFSVN